MAPIAVSASSGKVLIRSVRLGPVRTRALVTTQLFTGLRSYEVRNLTVGQVYRGGKIRPTIGVQPHCRKGCRGNTIWIPVVPELQRALLALIESRLKSGEALNPSDPLFLSRKQSRRGDKRPIGRKQAYRLVMRAFQRAHIEHDGRLGTHSLRKTYARKVFALSGNNLLVARDALGHGAARTTEYYLDVNREEVEEVIRRADWTRTPRSKSA